MSTTTKPYWPNVSGHPEGSYAGSYADGFGMKCDVYVVGKTAFIRCHDGRTEADVPVKTALGDPGQWPDVSALIRAHRPAPAAPQETREEEREWRTVHTFPPERGYRVECYARGWASVAQGVINEKTGRWDVWFGYDVTHMRPDVWRLLPDPPKPPPAPRIPTPDEVADAVEALKAVAEMAQTETCDLSFGWRQRLMDCSKAAMEKLTFSPATVRAMGKEQR